MFQNLPCSRLRPGAVALALAGGLTGLGAGGIGGAVMAQPSTEPKAAVKLSDIRDHRLQRLTDRLTADPAHLQAHCRYESGISTPPPPKRVALTFDDGPAPGQTESILDTLKKHEVRAAFFMIGKQAAEHPGLVQKVREAGHLVIANHSWDHPNFHAISVAQQAAQVDLSEQVLGPDLAPVKLFRYPYGNSSCETNELLHARGYKLVGWHVDSCDWAFDHNGSVDARAALTCGVHPQYRHNYVGHVLSSLRGHHGGVVLLHEIHPHTVAQLDALITAAKADGFSFGAIDDDEFAPALR